jgi:hypothetical protein
MKTGSLKPFKDVNHLFQIGLGKSSTSPTTFRKVRIVADDDRLLIVVADFFIWPAKVADDGRLLIVVADDVGRRSSRYTPILLSSRRPMSGRIVPEAIRPENDYYQKTSPTLAAIEPLRIDVIPSSPSLNLPPPESLLGVGAKHQSMADNRIALP